jgi:uncharacterized metal-binding protein YceD (DUF177 family)
MKILLSDIREQREDFHFRTSVRLDGMGDRAGEGEAELWVTVDPAGQRWTVSGRVEAQFPFRCDRCNRPFAGRLAGEFRLLVLAAAGGGIAAETAETAEDLVVLPAGSQELELMAPMLEALWLDLPIQLSCAAAGTGPCPGPAFAQPIAQDEPDPRWGPLAELKRRLEAGGKGPAGEGGDSGKD